MTPPPLKGFWSYARHDGENSSGRMDLLHKLISDELGAQLAVGRAADIFLDKSSIHTGDEWERMITDRLAEASFLIAILTPNFLQRPWCSKEIMLFRERERELGLSNLIFPIEYMDIADWRGRARHHVADQEALKLLESRQIKSFADLRFDDPNSRDVRRFIHDLCKEIKDRLFPLIYAPPTAQIPTTLTPPPAEPPRTAIIVPPHKPAPQPGDVMREPPGPEMVLIPAGTFLMGVPEAESKREGTNDNDSLPQHPVTIARPFWLGKYPVTRGEYAVFAAEIGRAGDLWTSPRFKQDDRHPVVNVSHADAEAYVAWLSQKTGQQYRLPSEAEWEYAARATTTTARHWGDPAGKPGEHAHFGSTDGTCPVGRFAPNAFGLHDMLGNVWEWVADPWHSNYKGAPTDGSVWTAGGAAYRVLRGGSWYDVARNVRSAFRYRSVPSVRVGLIGFRCARVQA